MKVQRAAEFDACFCSLPAKAAAVACSFLCAWHWQDQPLLLVPPQALGTHSQLCCPELILLFHGTHLRWIAAGLVALLLK